MKAKYIIRIDDICPTIDWDQWYRVEEILSTNGVKPILAVIPDNRDKKLDLGKANENFWHEVRRWQGNGWAIGLHGHQHSYVSQSRGVVGVNQYSEFAGLPFELQYEKLRQAIAIFKRESVRPDLWVAPAHTFDDNTIRALCLLDIRVISDGFYFRPHTDRRGVLWIPQQFGDFHRMPFGLWTICLHLYDPVHRDFGRLRRCIEKFRADIVDPASVIREFSPYRSGLVNEGFSAFLRWCKRIKAA